MARKGNPIGVRMSYISMLEGANQSKKIVWEIVTVVLFYGLIYNAYRSLGMTSACIMLIRNIRECLTYLLFFFPQSIHRRILFDIEISLGFGLQMLILKKFTVGIICLLLILFLLLIVNMEFKIKKEKSYIFEVFYYFLIFSPHFFLDLRWSFNFLVILFCLSLEKSIFNRINKDVSCSLKTLNFTLFFLLVYLFFKCDFPYKETSFYVQILFLIAGSLVIFFSFLSERGYELTITSFSYLTLNIYIARLITDNDTAFERCTTVYISALLVIFIFIFTLSLKKQSSIKKIINDNKGKFILTLLFFLDSILSFLYGDISTQYTWVEIWLSYFKLQIVILGFIDLYCGKK